MLKDASHKPELTCNLLYPSISNHADHALSVNPVSGVEKKTPSGCALHSHNVYKAGIVVFRENKNNLQTLVVRSANGGWGFPKGSRKRTENILETALRELWEETGLERDDIRLLQLSFVDEGKKPKGAHGLETAGAAGTSSPRKRPTLTRYFVAVVANDKVNRFHFDRSEILSVRWASVSATESLLRPSRKRVLSRACRTLDQYEKESRASIAGSPPAVSALRPPAVCELDQQLGALLIAPLSSPYTVTDAPCVSIPSASKSIPLAKL